MAADVYVRACAGYVPRLRVKREEYLRSLGSFAGAGVEEKAAAEFDEDAVTLAVEAGQAALAAGRAGEPAAGFGSGDLSTTPGPRVASLHLASTSLPYAEKAQTSTVAGALGLGPDVFSSEHTTSARAGTEAFVCAALRLAAGDAEDEQALVLASEASRLSPVDPAEHGLGAGAAAILLGHTGWARVLGWHSVTRESLGTRFRPAGSDRPRDLGLAVYGRRMLEEGVSAVISGLARAVAGAAALGSARPVPLAEHLAAYRLIILPQPDGRVPLELASKLGIKPSQVEPGLVVRKWGDQGSAQPWLALATGLGAMDGPAVGDRVLVVSYGPGLALDAVALEMTGPPVVVTRVPEPAYLSFGGHLRMRAAASGE